MLLLVTLKRSPLPERTHVDNAIETHGLTKYYGKSRGVVGLDLEVPQGEVFGFLGPNGAGKTTTIRLLLNLLQPTSGSATVLGMDVGSQSLEVRRACGVVSSDSAFYESLSGRAHLALMQSHHNGASHRGDALAERLGLDLDRPVKATRTGRGRSWPLCRRWRTAHSSSSSTSPLADLTRWCSRSSSSCCWRNATRA